MAFHARKQLARGPAEFHPAVVRAPAMIAVERLAKLAVAGTPARRMAAVACQIMAEWRAEPMQPDLLCEHLEALRTEVDNGVAAAEDYVADADERDKPKALIQLEGLRATQHALKAEAERLS
jgi:hypothetical protein